MSDSNTDTELEKIRYNHLPGVISKRIRRLYQERRGEVDLGNLKYLQPRQLINKLIIQYGLINGRDEVPLNDYLLDHWGSIEGGKTLVTEPYMHSSIWAMAENLVEAAGLSMEYIDTSIHNPRRPELNREEHRCWKRYCSRICFRIKKDD